MESIGEALKKMMSQRGLSTTLSSMTPKEIAERRCKSSNDIQGDLNEVDGYNCEKCKNKGFVFYIVEEKYNNGIYYNERSKPCECMKIRNSIRRMKASGLESTMKRCTFSKYEAKDEWQKYFKEKAIKFASDVDELEHKWFFVGGAVGCGKTHLCTAIVRELLYKGKEARYMLWVDESAKLKGLVNDTERYNELIGPLKKADVLYIDDFLKITKGHNGEEMKPTAADIKLAYEIINYRYLQPNLITIISSERYISEIEEIDSAVGSRIYEKTKESSCTIERKRERNYRTKDMNVV